VAGKTEGGSPIIRNPATRPVMEHLDNVLALIRFVQLLLLYTLTNRDITVACVG